MRVRKTQETLKASLDGLNEQLLAARRKNLGCRHGSSNNLDRCAHRPPGDLPSGRRRSSRRHVAQNRSHLQGTRRQPWLPLKNHGHGLQSLLSFSCSNRMSRYFSQIVSPREHRHPRTRRTETHSTHKPSRAFVRRSWASQAKRFSRRTRLTSSKVFRSAFRLVRIQPQAPALHGFPQITATTNPHRGPRQHLYGNTRHARVTETTTRHLTIAGVLDDALYDSSSSRTLATPTSELSQRSQGLKERARTTFLTTTSRTSKRGPDESEERYSSRENGS